MAPEPELSEGQTRVEIGVALSGGGHRAALFGLGALLYLAYAREADGRTPSNDTRLITSVSGGSITNAFFAQETDFPSATPEQITEVARRLASQIALRGTLFATWHAWLLISALFFCVTLAMTLSVLDPIPLVATAFRKPPPERTLAGIAELLISAVCMLCAAVVWQARGRVFARALAKTLFSEPRGRATTLADANRRPTAEQIGDVEARLGGRGFRQVLCGTEVQTGRPLYFSHSGVECAPFEIQLSGTQVPLAVAVQASAALPLAFPPRMFPASFRGVVGWQGRPPGHVVVVDGGVRDNLGVELFVEQHGIRPPQWMPAITRTIVVSGAANRLKQGSLQRILPGLGELASLWRVANFPYDTRERVQRRMLEATFGSDPGVGTVIHIEESPAEVASAIIDWSENWMWQGTPPDERLRTPTVERFFARRVHGIPGVENPPSNAIAGDLWWHHTNRALAVLTTLARAEGVELGRIFDRAAIAAGKSARADGFLALVDEWQRRTIQNASIPTNLSRLGIDRAAQLMLHGFALTMARMHLLWGYPLLDVRLPFFVDLARGHTPAVEVRPR